MIIDLQKLLAGIVETLERDVGPEVSPGRARSQFYSCLDLLNNLAAKLDWNQNLLATEIKSVEESLRSALPALERAMNGNRTVRRSLEPVVAAVHELLESPVAEESSLFPRRQRCNEVLERAIAAANDPGIIECADENTQALLEEAAGRFREHLREQTLRDAMYLKPMMLSKISQG